jgi:hypothetical protein
MELIGYTKNLFDVYEMKIHLITTEFLINHCLSFSLKNENKMMVTSRSFCWRQITFAG